MNLFIIITLLRYITDCKKNSYFTILLNMHEFLFFYSYLIFRRKKSYQYCKACRSPKVAVLPPKQNIPFFFTVKVSSNFDTQLCHLTWPNIARCRQMPETCQHLHSRSQITEVHSQTYQHTPRLLECVGSALALRGCVLACHCATFSPFVWEAETTECTLATTVQA